MKVRTILVPLDGLTLAEAALPKAWSWWRRPAPRAPASGGPRPDAAQGRSHRGQVKVVLEAEAYLAQVQERLTGRVASQSRPVWHGAVAHAIVEAARINKVEEIVMTTHGRRLSPSLRGSTTPILVVHAEGTAIQVPIGQANPGRRDEGL
jgi:nucleotide-binding universal stress UspA family protein